MPRKIVYVSATTHEKLNMVAAALGLSADELIARLLEESPLVKAAAAAARRVLGGGK